MLTIEERRARKAERRAKQREITILRAGKMHKARMLAEATPATSACWPPKPQYRLLRVFYRHLKDSFYSTQMPTRNGSPTMRTFQHRGAERAVPRSFANGHSLSVVVTILLILQLAWASKRLELSCRSSTP